MMEFGEMTGLRLNDAKTVVLMVGDESIPRWSTTTGFCYKDHLHVLGHNINSYGSVTEDALTEIKKKISYSNKKMDQI